MMLFESSCPDARASVPCHSVLSGIEDDRVQGQGIKHCLIKAHLLIVMNILCLQAQESHVDPRY